jgi:hypothetical protein
METVAPDAWRAGRSSTGLPVVRREALLAGTVADEEGFARQAGLGLIQRQVQLQQRVKQIAYPVNGFVIRLGRVAAKKAPMLQPRDSVIAGRTGQRQVTPLAG